MFRRFFTKLIRRFSAGSQQTESIKNEAQNISLGQKVMDNIFRSDADETARLLTANLAAHICIHEAGHYVYAVRAKDEARGFKIERLSLGNLENIVANGGYAGGVKVDHTQVGDADVLEFLLAGAAAEAVAHGVTDANEVMAAYLHPTASRGDLTEAIRHKCDIEGLNDADRIAISDNTQHINVILANILPINGELLIESLVDDLVLLQNVSAYIYDSWAANGFNALEIRGDALSYLPR